MVRTPRLCPRVLLKLREARIRHSRRATVALVAGLQARPHAVLPVTRVSEFDRARVAALCLDNVSEAVVFFLSAGGNF